MKKLVSLLLPIEGRPFCQGSGGRPRCLLNCGLGTGGPVAHKLGQVSACSYSYSGGGGQI